MHTKEMLGTTIVLAQAAVVGSLILSVGLTVKIGWAAYQQAKRLVVTSLPAPRSGLQSQK